jgi:xylan 1,4-beta-xylosidase
MRHLCIVLPGCLAVSFASPVSVQANQNSLREVAVNVRDTRGPVDRFFDLSVGSDYPGTLIRDDSQRNSN